MRALRLLGGVVAALLAHLLLVRVFPGVGGLVDFFAIVLVISARRSAVVPAALLGAGLGWLEDALTGSLFGLHGIAGTLTGAVIARVSQQVSLQQTPLLTTVFAVAVAFQEVVSAVLLRMLLTDPPAPAPAWVLLTSLVTALVGGSIVLLLRRLGGRWRRYRRHRTPKIRFEGKRA